MATAMAMIISCAVICWDYLMSSRLLSRKGCGAWLFKFNSTKAFWGFFEGECASKSKSGSTRGTIDVPFLLPSLLAWPDLCHAPCSAFSYRPTCNVCVLASSMIDWVDSAQPFRLGCLSRTMHTTMYDDDRNYQIIISTSCKILFLLLLIKRPFKKKR
jgi:hypothetical protein